MAEQEVNYLGKLIYKLIAADNLSFFLLTENRGHNLEKLKGKRRYQMSLRTQRNSGYRLIFECTNTTIDDDYSNMKAIYILEVTNHEY
jgi:plasmid maintenance system killer protein